ncbi:MAG: Uma2 family endonuclease [Chloroflexota bacterium]
MTVLTKPRVYENPVDMHKIQFFTAEDFTPTQTHHSNNGNHPEAPTEAYDLYNEGFDNLDDTLFDPSVWMSPDNPAYYGFGYRKQINADGTETYVEVPLKREDLLNPQEGDKLVNNLDHDGNSFYLRYILDIHLRKIVGALVTYDVGFDWNHPDITQKSPDIAVTFNFKETIEELARRGEEGVFNVKDRGTAPTLIIELTSPHTRSEDLTEKFSIYQTLGVPYYVILDTSHRWKRKKSRILAYQHINGQYVQLEPNDEGRIWLEPVQLWIGLRGNKGVFYNKEGYELLGPQGQQDAFEEAVQRAEQEEQRAEQEAQRAEQEAQRAEKLAEKLRALGIDPDTI